MRLRTIGLAAALSANLIHTSDAVVRQKGAENPVVATGRAPRTHRTTSWSRASQLANAGLAGWTAIWDADTDVPLRMWGPGVLTPGSMTNPSIAESAARQFLSAHLEMLAPGARLDDFVLVANQLGGFTDVRTVGFEQRVNGMHVIGGSIGFAFKQDRLILVSSTALPHVIVTAAPHKLATAIESAATSWLAAAGRPVKLTPSSAPLGEVILPLVQTRTNHGADITYKVAEQVSVESITNEPGRWDVWIDAADGRPIARRSTLMFASGTVMFDVPDQYPGGGRHPRPVPNATDTVNGQAVTSALDGTVTWAGTNAATVLPGLTGPLFAITNMAGALVTDTLTLPVGGSVVWSKATDELADAQLISFSSASIVKQFAKTHLAPMLGYLDQQLSVTVNESQTCNAYSTGDDIHFLRGNAMCENTGRVPDVLYHEFGHSLHAHSIIPGQGQFDGALSEGLADTLAVSITNDHGVGRGFFKNTTLLRDLDPTVKKKWPQDVTGEVHNDGEITGETLWDLRKAMIAKLGADAGFARTMKIYYTIMQRATDIPSSYAEALVADDDDGDLSNGTPNICLINTVFGAHGLADPSITLGIAPPVRDVFTISLSATPGSGSSSCPGPTISSAVVAWRARGGTDAQVTLAMSGTKYSGVIPTQPDGTVVEYKVTVTLSDGSSVAYPNNPADPYYQFYVGAVTKLWCADFESGAADWSHSATPSNGDVWEAGTPMGIGGGPKMAHGGTGVLGTDLSNNGTYVSNSKSFAESPDIDLQGHTNVRLQYYRWLGVEDGFYDKATISANATSVWGNFASSTDPMSAEINHVDREWRFQDVDLSAQATTGKIKLRFELDSDPGLELAGWNLDDVCIVTSAAAGPKCGNGVVDTGETCDDGNTVDGDGCSASCQTENGVDPGKNGGGCCSVGGDPVGSFAAGGLVLGMLLRRRRRSSKAA